MQVFAKGVASGSLLSIRILSELFFSIRVMVDPSTLLENNPSKTNSAWLTLRYPASTNEGARPGPNSLPSFMPVRRKLCGHAPAINYGSSILKVNPNECFWCLEKKEDMKKRGLASSDCGDALAVTFAHPVAPKGVSAGPSQAAKTRREYNPFAKNINL